ncbi:MAG: carbon-nitrogen hydrolase family protein [Calditrichia bacterium]|jgi:predicted amidohydrolase|nr:carbon-nitrogen hydrolase family protein [Calditrichia bacterium]
MKKYCSFLLSFILLFLSGIQVSAMDKFTVTVGQLILSDPQDVFNQINKIFVENPKTDLFVFPEFATKYNINLKAVEYLNGNPKAKTTALKWLNLVPDFSKVKDLSDKFGKAIIIGCIAQSNKKLFSRAYFYDPKNNQLDFYDKTHVHWTEDFLRPGNKIETTKTRFGKIGILICYDMAFVEPAKVHGINNTELLFALSAIPMHFHWKYSHYRMIGAAIFNQYYVIAANLGYTLKAPMGGYSGIYSPEGDLIEQIKGTNFGYISANIDLNHVKLWREKEMINPYRKPQLYKSITTPIKNK